jgi:hypothetical protein
MNPVASVLECLSGYPRRRGELIRLGSAPRTQRTRQHVIADQSVNYVERFIIDEGHTAQRLERDYGYDLLLFTYDDQGYAEPGVAFLQLKASETLTQSGSHCVYDLDIRDYNLWMVENTPVFLILFEARHRRAYWLHIQPYFRTYASRQPRKGARTVRVEVSRRQTISRRGVAAMRELKRRADTRITTESSS